MSLSNSASNGKLSLVQVKNSMFNKETRRKDLGIDSSQALVIENRGRTKSRGQSRKSKDRLQSQSRRKFNCYHCRKEGHIKRNCKVWKNREKKNHRSQDIANDKNTTSSVAFFRRRRVP